MTIIPGEPGWEQDDNKPEGNQGRGEGCHRGKFFSFSFGPIFSGSVLVVSLFFRHNMTKKYLIDHVLLI